MTLGIITSAAYINPEMAAEFCGPGVEPASGNQVVNLIAEVERASPDPMGGLPLAGAVTPLLGELGLAAVLGVVLSDKETQATAGMLLAGFAGPHIWRPHETYFLQSVGDQMLLGVKHTRLRSLMRNLAVADEKTGLLRRSSYQDCLMREIQLTAVGNYAKTLISQENYFERDRE